VCTAKQAFRKGSHVKAKSTPGDACVVMTSLGFSHCGFEWALSRFGRFWTSELVTSWA